jgi:uncharacterized protein (TIGR03437 family)
VRLVSMKVLLVLAFVAGLQAQAPSVGAGGIVDAAGFSAPVAPGSLVSIFGNNLAGSLALADSIPLSTTLNNVSVTFNGIAAPLLFVSTGQINAQLPWNVLSSGTTGTANMVVTRAGQPPATQTVQVGPFGPGIFADAATKIAIAVNPDGTLAAAPGAIPGLTTHPAKIGDPGGLIIYCTGLGAVSPPVQTGDKVTDGQLHNATTMPTVLIGGKPATVVFAGMSPQFVGVNQVNVAIPAGTPTGDKVSLQLQVGGITTSASIVMAVSN